MRAQMRAIHGCDVIGVDVCVILICVWRECVCACVRERERGRERERCVYACLCVGVSVCVYVCVRERERERERERDRECTCTIYISEWHIPYGEMIRKMPIFLYTFRAEVRKDEHRRGNTTLQRTAIHNTLHTLQHTRTVFQ